MLKLLPLICAAYFVASCSALADDQQKRFIEFPDGGDMTTYDLNTVQLIQPGKFTIIYTVVSNPDFMRLELKALDILREYCKRDDGLYPAPTDLLTLGPSDMPVKNIEVKNVDAQTKRTSWSYPYSKFAWPDGRQYSRVFFLQKATLSNAGRRVFGSPARYHARHSGETAL
jgi:hypothetical protein